MDKIRAYYNHVLNDKFGRFYRTINEVIHPLSQNSKVLDYGTGTGVYAHYITSKYGCMVDAIDVDIDALNDARAA